jgi:nucleoside-diphosphate-sugar epimerase
VTSRVLVTGATGFVGRHVVERLAADHQLTAVSLRGGDVGGIPVQAVDLADRAATLTALGGVGFDAVVHLAAAIPKDLGAAAMQASHDATVAVDSTVAALCQALGCRLVYASSSAVYGLTDNGRPASEDRVPKPANLYAAAKLAGERLCDRHARITGAPATVLRISAPYGPGARRTTVVELFLKRALESEDLELLGSGSRTQDFTYVGDIAAAVSAALDAGVAGVFNVATGRSASMGELARAALEAVPGTTSRILRPGTPDPQETYRASYDVSRAQSELGWTAATSLEYGRRATVAALRQTQ